MKLTLSNYQKDALPLKVVVNLAENTCTLDDVSIVERHQLFDLDFHHPLLNEASPRASGAEYTYVYDNFRDLTRCGRFIYSTLLKAKDPRTCRFAIKPTSNYRQHKKTYKIPFSLNPKKPSQKTLSLAQFNEIASWFRDCLFEYQDHVFLEKVFSFQDLPAEINGDRLYEEDLDFINFCERADALEDYDIRYLHHLIGLGVFARKNIPKGTWIGLYCGLKTIKDPEYLNYTYRGVKDCLNLDIDAKNCGNFTRFINHADHPWRYDELEPELSYANISANIRSVNGHHFILFIADQEIKAGEQLLVDYGGRYFTHLHDKFFFHRNGRIVNIRGQKISRDSGAKKNALFAKMATYKIPGAQSNLVTRTITALLGTTISCYLLMRYF